MPHRSPQDTRFATGLVLALVVLVALAPLPLGSNRPAPVGLLSAAAGVLMLAWAAAAARDGRLVGVRWSRWGWLAAAVLALAGWQALQGTTGIAAALAHPVWTETAAALGHPVAGAISAAPEQSRGHAMRLLCYAALFFLAMQLGRSSRHADLVLCGLAAAATAYAAYGLTVMLLGLDSILFYPKWAYHESLTATFVNRNHYATYAGLGLLATVGLLGRQWREARLEAGIHRDPQAAFADQFGRRGWLLAAAATVQAFALLLSHSRAGFVATVLGFAALAAVGWLGRRERPRPAEAAALVGAGLVVLAAVMLAALGGGEAALSDRAAIYRATLAGIAERPWAGHGAGSFPELVLRHVGGPLALGSELVERAHNTYLEVAFELGLPGFLLWLALPAAVVLRCLRGVGERHRNVLYPAVGVAATVLVGSHALFDFSLQIPAVAATYATLMGLAYAQSFRTDGAPAYLPRAEPRGRSGPLLRRR